MCLHYGLVVTSRAEECARSYVSGGEGRGVVKESVVLQNMPVI